MKSSEARFFSWLFSGLLCLSILLTLISDAFSRTFLVFFLSFDVFVCPTVLSMPAVVSRSGVSFLCIGHAALAVAMTIVYFDGSHWLADESTFEFILTTLVNAALSGTLGLIWYHLSKIKQ